MNPEHTHEDDRVLIRNMELVNWCKQEVVANLHRPIFDIFNEAVLRFGDFFQVLLEKKKVDFIFEFFLDLLEQVSHSQESSEAYSAFGVP